MSLFWQMHREYEPTRILSLRVIQGHLGDEEPRFGNRLMIHALLKFDTEQVRLAPTAFQDLTFLSIQTEFRGVQRTRSSPTRPCLRCTKIK